MSLVRCPTCDKSFNSEDSAAMPFSSTRCRQIDLNRWLNEEIALPYQDAAEEDRPPEDSESN
jgi:endogenous inhibitor of DNA gyrase (YacG/DUF329 family)